MKLSTFKNLKLDGFDDFNCFPEIQKFVSGDKLDLEDSTKLKFLLHVRPRVPGNQLNQDFSLNKTGIQILYHNMNHVYQLDLKDIYQ